MKNIIIIIVLILGISYTSDALDLKKYQLKSGIVEYKITGSQTGSQTLYFDKWGMLSAEFTKSEMKFMGFTTSSNTLNLTDLEWTYSINLDEKKGTKTANKDLMEMMGNMNQKEAEEYGLKVMEQLGGRKLGDEMFFGKMCEVYEIEKLGSKVWSYKWIPLKMEIKLIGNVVYEAIKFEENVSVPSDKFKVPDGIEVTEEKFTEEEKESMEEMMKMLGK